MTIYNVGHSLCPPLTEEMIASAEKKLGYKLPGIYVNALREKNGGYLALDAFPTSRPTNYAPTMSRAQDCWESAVKTVSMETRGVSI